MNKFQQTAVKWLGLSYLVDAANWRERYRRPQEVRTTNTISREINMSDWLQLLSDSRKLYCNLGPVTGAIDDKATYSVGRAWNPKFTGKDQDWGHEAEEWLRDQWYPMADARGGAFDFKTDLFLASVCTDRDGEIYIFLTESEDGWPQIQLVPAHMVGSREDKEMRLESGPYRGLRMIQGVVVNDMGRAVAYNVMGEEAKDDKIYSARDLIQVFDPRWPDQVRGLPVFTHALLDLKDLRTVQGYEKTAAMLMASVGLIEYNEEGAPDPGDPMNLLTKAASQEPGVIPSVVTQDFAGGTAHFFRSNSGSKLEGLKNDRPGLAVSEFMDRLIRNACVGAGWPYELTWDASKLGGANVRLLIAKAMRAVEDRQDLLRPVARRVVGYAVAKAIKSGLLRDNAEWYKWNFTMPARMTADYGRDKAQDREDLLANITTLAEIVGEKGGDLDEHLRDLKEQKEKLEAAGLTLGDAAPAENVSPQNDVLKAKVEAYGVAVRAGAITPQKDDEAYFRSEAGLPGPSTDVDGAWTEDGGVRRPITLQVDGGKQPPPQAQTPPPDNGELAAKQTPEVIQLKEALAELESRVKEQKSLDEICAELSAGRKRSAK